MRPAARLPAPPAARRETLAGQISAPGRCYICSDGVLGVLSLPAVSVWTEGGCCGGDGGRRDDVAGRRHARARRGGWLI